jgi:hypothetical protein
MTFAINFDWNNDYAWEQRGVGGGLYTLGFRGVRAVSNARYVDRITTLRSMGLDVLAVVTDESQGFVPWNASIVQVGNEPDGPGGMTPREYADYWNIYRETYPDFRMFSAGLCSGGMNAVNYLAAAWPDMRIKPEAIAIHPYNKTPQEAAGDFDLMWNQFQVPVIATEWFRDAASTEIWDFQAMLDDRSSVWNSWFCWTDAMVKPFGLLDMGGLPKDEFYALLSFDRGESLRRAA